MAISQTSMESNEALLGGQLMIHMKSYIKLFIAEQNDLQNTDTQALAAKISEITSIIDGDPDSEGYQAFQGLLDDVSSLKADNTSNKTRLTAVETALNAVDQAWQAEILRVENESKSRDAALGGRIDTVEASIAQYAAARLDKDTEHDGKIATLEAFKDNVTLLLQQEIDRALAKEAELQSAITANTESIDTLNTQMAERPTRMNVDSGFVAFCQGAETELWADRSDKPAGLPVFTSAA